MLKLVYTGISDLILWKNVYVVSIYSCDKDVRLYFYTLLLFCDSRRFTRMLWINLLRYSIIIIICTYYTRMEKKNRLRLNISFKRNFSSRWTQQLNYCIYRRIVHKYEVTITFYHIELLTERYYDVSGKFGSVFLSHNTAHTTTRVVLFLKLTTVSKYTWCTSVEAEKINFESYT